MIQINKQTNVLNYIPYVSYDAKCIVSGGPESQFPSPTEVRSIENSWNTDWGTRVLGTGFLIISWFCFSCKKRRRKELYNLYIVKCIHISFKYYKTKRARRVVTWWQGSQEINTGIPRFTLLMLGHTKKTRKQKPRKSKLLSSTY